MAEEKTEKTPAEGTMPEGKPAQKTVRDKSGRFASKKPEGETENTTKADDGTVKIKVAKEPKEKKGKKDNPAKKGDEDAYDAIKVSIIELPDFDGDWVDDFWSVAAPLGLARLFASKGKADDEVAEKKPVDSTGTARKEVAIRESSDGTIEVDGQKYYSTSTVAKLIAKTIATCAEAASKEMAQAATAEAEKKAEKVAKRKALARKISEKASKILANIVLTAIILGVVSTAGFGLYSLGKLIFG